MMLTKRFLEECNKYAVDIIADYSNKERTGKVIPSLQLQGIIRDIKSSDVDLSDKEVNYKYSDLKSLDTEDKIAENIINNEGEWDRLLLSLKYSTLVLDKEYLPKIDLLLRTISNRDKLQEKVWQSNFKAGLE